MGPSDPWALPIKLYKEIAPLKWGLSPPKVYWGMGAQSALYHPLGEDSPPKGAIFLYHLLDFTVGILCMKYKQQTQPLESVHIAEDIKKREI